MGHVLTIPDYRNRSDLKLTTYLKHNNAFNTEIPGFSFYGEKQEKEGIYHHVFQNSLAKQQDKKRNCVINIEIRD